MSAIRVLAFVPLQEEFESISEIFPSVMDYAASESGVTVMTAVSGVENVALSIATSPDWGDTQAALAVREAMAAIEPDVVVCLGIAGAVSDDLALTDVCVSQDIIHFTSKSKMNGAEIEIDTKPYNIPFRLHNAL